MAGAKAEEEDEVVALTGEEEAVAALDRFRAKRKHTNKDEVEISRILHASSVRNRATMPLIVRIKC